ncbi:carboxymuconolactone decarboxylase family protein [Paracoccus pantotrophus]|uniref:Carboxymuconolactone decarboxylase family protein n=2 Tax=Paracoccus pantotrophus TaxID=82367 RepID=A0A7H9BS69_PARPN|nr:carboxymuconolactone decarboxylase family protein [Paracoccus pantotrophus]
MPADPTPEQAEVVAEVVAGKRGKVPAPMIPWLRNPELARRAQRLGELLRFDTSLEPELSELAILVCGRHWTSHHEWTAHKRIGLAAGLDPRTVEDIAARAPSPYIRSDRERIVLQVARTLLAETRLDDALYAEGVAILGETGMVDLVAILGYYCMVALTLNAFQIGLPDSFAPELLDTEAC